MSINYAKFVEGSWHSKIIAAYAEGLYTQYNDVGVKYLEIGVRDASTFNMVLPFADEDSIGVDVLDIESHMRGGVFYHGSSDDFFKDYVGPKFDIIFIDGLHTYDQIKLDFWNSFGALESEGVIFIHDAYPVTSEDNGCGTGWKFIKELQGSDDLYCAVFKAFPGLALVTKPTYDVPS